jgi:hypothetical protein
MSVMVKSIYLPLGVGWNRDIAPGSLNLSTR